jgi:hypothetical protein
MALRTVMRSLGSPKPTKIALATMIANIMLAGLRQSGFRTTKLELDGSEETQNVLALSSVLALYENFQLLRDMPVSHEKLCQCRFCFAFCQTPGEARNINLTYSYA